MNEHSSDVALEHDGLHMLQFLWYLPRPADLLALLDETRRHSLDTRKLKLDLLARSLLLDITLLASSVVSLSDLSIMSQPAASPGVICQVTNAASYALMGQVKSAMSLSMRDDLSSRRGRSSHARQHSDKLARKNSARRSRGARAPPMAGDAASLDSEGLAPPSAHIAHDDEEEDFDSAAEFGHNNSNDNVGLGTVWDTEDPQALGRQSPSRAEDRRSDNQPRTQSRQSRRRRAHSPGPFAHRGRRSGQQYAGELESLSASAMFYREQAAAHHREAVAQASIPWGIVLATPPAAYLHVTPDYTESSSKALSSLIMRSLPLPPPAPAAVVAAQRKSSFVGVYPFGILSAVSHVERLEQNNERMGDAGMSGQCQARSHGMPQDAETHRPRKMMGTDSDLHRSARGSSDASFTEYKGRSPPMMGQHLGGQDPARATHSASSSANVEASGIPSDLSTVDAIGSRRGPLYQAALTTPGVSLSSLIALVSILRSRRRVLSGTLDLFTRINLESALCQSKFATSPSEHESTHIIDVPDPRLAAATAAPGGSVQIGTSSTFGNGSLPSPMASLGTVRGLTQPTNLSSRLDSHGNTIGLPFQGHWSALAQTGLESGLTKSNVLPPSLSVLGQTPNSSILRHPSTSAVEAVTAPLFGTCGELAALADETLPPRSSSCIPEDPFGDLFTALHARQMVAQGNRVLDAGLRNALRTGHFLRQSELSALSMLNTVLSAQLALEDSSSTSPSSPNPSNLHPPLNRGKPPQSTSRNPHADRATSSYQSDSLSGTSSSSASRDSRRPFDGDATAALCPDYSMSALLGAVMDPYEKAVYCSLVNTLDVDAYSIFDTLTPAIVSSPWINTDALGGASYANSLLRPDGFTTPQLAVASMPVQIASYTNVVSGQFSACGSSLGGVPVARQQATFHQLYLSFLPSSPAIRASLSQRMRRANNLMEAAAITLLENLPEPSTVARFVLAASSIPSGVLTPIYDPAGVPIGPALSRWAAPLITQAMNAAETTTSALNASALGLATLSPSQQAVARALISSQASVYAAYVLRSTASLRCAGIVTNSHREKLSYSSSTSSSSSLSSFSTSSLSSSSPSNAASSDGSRSKRRGSITSSLTPNLAGGERRRRGSTAGASTNAGLKAPLTSPTSPGFVSSGPLNDSPLGMDLSSASESETMRNALETLLLQNLGAQLAIETVLLNGRFLDASAALRLPKLDLPLFVSSHVSHAITNWGEGIASAPSVFADPNSALVAHLRHMVGPEPLSHLLFSVSPPLRTFGSEYPTSALSSPGPHLTLDASSDDGSGRSTTGDGGGQLLGKWATGLGVIGGPSQLVRGGAVAALAGSAPAAVFWETRGRILQTVGQVYQSTMIDFATDLRPKIVGSLLPYQSPPSTSSSSSSSFSTLRHGAEGSTASTAWIGGSSKEAREGRVSSRKSALSTTSGRGGDTSGDVPLAVATAIARSVNTCKTSPLLEKELYGLMPVQSSLTERICVLPYETRALLARTQVQALDCQLLSAEVEVFSGIVQALCQRCRREDPETTEHAIVATFASIHRFQQMLEANKYTFANIRACHDSWQAAQHAPILYAEQQQQLDQDKDADGGTIDLTLQVPFGDRSSVDASSATNKDLRYELCLGADTSRIIIVGYQELVRGLKRLARTVLHSAAGIAQNALDHTTSLHANLHRTSVQLERLTENMDITATHAARQKEQARSVAVLDAQHLLVLHRENVLQALASANLATRHSSDFLFRSLRKEASTEVQHLIAEVIRTRRRFSSEARSLELRLATNANELMQAVVNGSKSVFSNTDKQSWHHLPSSDHHLAHHDSSFHVIGGSQVHRNESTSTSQSAASSALLSARSGSSDRISRETKSNDNASIAASSLATGAHDASAFFSILTSPLSKSAHVVEGELRTKQNMNTLARSAQHAAMGLFGEQATRALRGLIRAGQASSTLVTEPEGASRASGLLAGGSAGHRFDAAAGSGTSRALLERLGALQTVSPREIDEDYKTVMSLLASEAEMLLSEGSQLETKLQRKREHAGDRIMSRLVEEAGMNDNSSVDSGASSSSLSSSSSSPSSTSLSPESSRSHGNSLKNAKSIQSGGSTTATKVDPAGHLLQAQPIPYTSQRSMLDGIVSVRQSVLEAEADSIALVEALHSAAQRRRELVQWRASHRHRVPDLKDQAQAWHVAEKLHENLDKVRAVVSFAKALQHASLVIDQVYQNGSYVASRRDITTMDAVKIQKVMDEVNITAKKAELVGLERETLEHILANSQVVRLYCPVLMSCTGIFDYNFFVIEF